MSLVCPAPAQHHSREPLTPFGYPVGFWTLTTRYGICVFPDGAATNPSPKGEWFVAAIAERNSNGFGLHGRRRLIPRRAQPPPAGHSRCDGWPFRGDFQLFSLRKFSQPRLDIEFRLLR